MWSKAVSYARHPVTTPGWKALVVLAFMACLARGAWADGGPAERALNGYLKGGQKAVEVVNAAKARLASLKAKCAKNDPGYQYRRDPNMSLFIMNHVPGVYLIALELLDKPQGLYQEVLMYMLAMTGWGDGSYYVTPFLEGDQPERTRFLACWALGILSSRHALYALTEELDQTKGS